MLRHDLPARPARARRTRRRLAPLPRPERHRPAGRRPAAVPDRRDAERRLEDGAAAGVLVARRQRRSDLRHRLRGREAADDRARPRHGPRALAAREPPRRAARSSTGGTVPPRRRRSPTGRTCTCSSPTTASSRTRSRGPSAGGRRSGPSTTSTAWARRRCSRATWSCSSATRTAARSRPASARATAARSGARRVRRRSPATRRRSSTTRRADRCRCWHPGRSAWTRTPWPRGRASPG